MSMNYHLYYHDDFDGMASGAVMLNFLRSRGDDIISFNPIDYTPELNENWAKHKFKKPFILVDFRYHPAASWWFDHHETSFDKPANSSWQKTYQNNSTHHRDPEFKSCCSLVLAHLIKKQNYNPPEHIQELARWLDIIDGAAYKYLRDVIESKVAPLKLRTYLFYEKSKSRRFKFLNDLAFKPMSDIMAQGHIVKKVKKADTDIKIVLKNLKKCSVLSEKVIFVDATQISSNVSHYMAYFNYPKHKYSIILEKQEGYYHLGAGFNRWQKDKQCTNIGGLMLKYDGGGHKTVGAVEKKSKKEIVKIAEKIIKYLNKHG